MSESEKMSQNKSKPKKIVFCGLDNGGKTSILMFLNRQFSLISKVKPTTKRQVTKGAVSVLGLDLNIWDLGGQQAYREEHLGNKQRYFSKVSSLFYVIDVQDANRFEESIQFFLEVVNGAKEINPNLSSVYVFFHKYDPDIKKDDGLETDIEDLEQKITSLPLDVE